MKPVFGAVLIGGKSSRMGSPKQLLVDAAGQTWLERTCRRLEKCVERVVISGSGALPDSLPGFEVIDDLPGIPGPLAGIAAVLAAYPHVSWLIVACDMPNITVEAIEWVLAQRAVGSSAVIPCNELTAMAEPLFAWYDSCCLAIIAQMIGAGEYRPRRIVKAAPVHCVMIPAHLRICWQNVNDRQAFKGLGFGP